MAGGPIFCAALYMRGRVTNPKGHWSERYGIKLYTGRGTVVAWALQLFVDLMTLENAL